MKSFIKSIFHSFGLEISRKERRIEEQDYFRNEEMILGLKRCNSILPGIKTIIDVGAAAGSWSLSAFELWGESDYLLLEPLHERKEELQSLENKHSNFHFVHAAAGQEKGELSFFVSNDLDGSGITTENSNEKNIRKVHVVRIDEEIQLRKLQGPYLIKLDTHGFEVPIIEGCQKMMDEISVFIIECYGFQIAEKSLLFWEMCHYMDQLGFRLFDIVDVMNRSKDGAFWQCDGFFIRKDSPVFHTSGYQ